jgi:hypothetical protein
LIQSCWSTLKNETGLDATITATRQNAELAVFNYIKPGYTREPPQFFQSQIVCGYRIQPRKKIQAAKFGGPLFQGMPDSVKPLSSV